MDSGYQPQGRSQVPSLFVGGLAFAATEHDLRDTFSACGDINSCRIVTDRETGRSKGFAFIEFANEDSMNQAIRDLNGAMICGRPVRLDAGGKGKGKGGKGGFDQGRGGAQGDYRDQRSFDGHQSGSGYGQRQGYGESEPRQQSGYQGGYQGGDRYSRPQETSSYGGYGRSSERQEGRPQETASYGGYGRSSDRQPETSYGGYGRDSRPQESYGRSNRSQETRGRERSRSRSLSSATKERRQRERHARKEQFSKSNQSWDRRPTAEEMATQDAEREAVRAAEAQGKDITTIRADFLKQSYASYN